MVWQSVLGIVVFSAVAWGFGRDTRAVAWKTVAVGLAMQFALALVLLKGPGVRSLFVALNDAVLALQAATEAGTSFVFGYLGGGDLPFQESYPGAAFVLAFKALPLMLVMSALSALLFHWRVLPLVVGAFSWALRRTLGVGGAVGVGAAANVFVGMIEAPLLIRPYLRALSRAELFMVMTCGMATVAGTVMVLYATFISGVVPDAMGHILTASIISAPAAIMVARLMVPDRGERTGADDLRFSDAGSTMEAITRGTLDGVTLLINVIAMLLVLVALVSLANQILGLLPDAAGAPLTLQRVLGWALAPVAWLLGLPWSEAVDGGALLGVKVVLNELLAYLDLARAAEGTFSPRSRLILTYALCGFANLGSLGIMIGGLGAMAPERRGEIVELGMRSVASGMLATCLTGAVVGVLTP
ncbi:MAG: nucleoside:proton symporter [Hyphomicrobiales bacterium]|nr:nucleoside:proton symporter [Hyphomicrobiales bacterium]MCP5371909.1 nucleoside:proton symporter [Hyphomicrobiales bacterium]